MTPTGGHQQHAHQHDGDGEGDFVTTTLTNPGIIDRLEQDITDYLSIFGFSLRRQVELDESSCRIGHVRCNAVLVIPRLLIGDNCVATNNDTITASSTAVSSSIPVAEPIATLHLHINDASLLATVGPLLRTFLRLSPSHIHPLLLRAVIHCQFTLDALEKINKMSAEQKVDQLNRQEELSARRMAHHVHMLVRNSMGSALCLQLVVVLPWYWRRQSTQEEDNATIRGVNSPYIRTNVPISVNSVMSAMKENPDACYPTVQLVEQCKQNGTDTTDDHSIHDECSTATLYLHVRTRMCTVRHQPLLFRWISSWTTPTINHQCQGAMHPESHRVDRFPLIVTCIEKVGNLHRILMLVHDHDEKDRNTRGISGSSLSTELVIIMPTTAKDLNDKTRRNFDDAIDNFHQVVIGEEQGYQRPTLICEEGAADMLHKMVVQRQAFLSTEAPPRIVGIDLHPDALTLNGDYATSTPISPALQSMRDADVILFGYESTGIPSNIADELVNSWVQIPSRSSINVVAAMSIVFDALSWSASDGKALRPTTTN
ncbi:hypothetical protein ACHAWU_004217 [Discostella pseudostelligera]|uniref:tRNA/rRNA methyltransferase SpoU type domain-containing protein n=1 Tax=Discostella pseudostelligera TaxID=259834 RepID=A0ABD3M837_9STRA